MGWSYLGGKMWAEVTRDERFFCQHLYRLIQEDVPGFVQKLNELSTMNLPLDTEWEVGFEVCFYRDHWHLWKKQGKLYSPKRTFDLCLFSHDHIVIIEAKAQQGFDSKQMEEFRKDREWVKEATSIGNSSVNVHVVALASSKYLARYQENQNWERFNSDTSSGESIFSGRAISWNDLAKHFKKDQKDGDLILSRADEIYDIPGPGGKHNTGGFKTGKELMILSQQGKSLFVGRNGGLDGRHFGSDLKDDQWKTQRYETSLADTKPDHKNWFTLQQFVAAMPSRP